MMAVEIVGADGTTPDPARTAAANSACLHARGVVTLTAAPAATCSGSCPRS